MTEVVATSSHPLLASALSGPFTRSAMSTRSVGVGLARQHGPGTSTTAAPFSSAPASASPPLPGSPPPPRGPMTRKRAASINTEEANHPHPHPRIEDLSLNTPNTGSPQPLDTNLICLCTPAPKVPRPRNAFILYRQHHQAGVVARNPGLANPEISKIIGENWRDEPEEHKSQWKRLAEEEKQRHQRQYPDYRYQPRRGNKGALPRLTSTGGGDPGRCDKCGGRYIATPRTPLTPFVTPPSSAVKTSSSMPPPSYSGRGAEMAEHHYRQQPQMGGNRGGRPQWANVPVHAQGSGVLYDIHEDYETMSPSEAKRRRYNVAGAYHNQHYQPLPSPSTPYGGHPTRAPHPRHSSLSGPPTGPPTPGYGPSPSGPLPGPSMITRGSSAPGVGPGPGPSSGHMGPPPRPGGSISSSLPYPHPHPPASRLSGGGPSSEFDESLRLPPLQTHLPTSPASEGSGGGVSMASYNTAPVAGSHYQNPRDRDREAHARSVEAMVMSIPYVNKLRVLERISPPLAPPGVSGGIVSPGSGPESTGMSMTRGPIIAVEGPDARLLKQVAPIIERALLASGECSVRLWHASADDTQPGAAGPTNSSSEDMAMPDPTRRSTASSRSASISSASASNPFSAYLQAIMDWHTKSSEMVKFVTTPAPTMTATPTARLSDASSSTEPTSNDARPTSDDHPSRHLLSHQHRPHNHVPPLPIALLPSGFSLTVSDRFACAVPILDAYAPVDHWQWMATLWRGIAGADLVVYVRAASEEELGRLQGVELKAPGLMVVRVGVKEGAEAEAGVVGEKTERRLGFEVVEWVRGGAFYHWHHGGGGGLGITGNGGWE